jgi:hypothetical protein
MYLRAQANCLTQQIAKEILVFQLLNRSIVDGVPPWEGEKRKTVTKVVGRDGENP